jgi:hypothetical protein
MPRCRGCRYDEQQSAAWSLSFLPTTGHFRLEDAVATEGFGDRHSLSELGAHEVFSLHLLLGQFDGFNGDCAGEDDDSVGIGK